MSFLDRFRSPKTILRHKLMKTIKHKDYSYIRIKVGDTDYDLDVDKLTGITWRDETAAAAYRKKVNLRVKRDENGEMVTTKSLPFGGEFGAQFGWRDYPVYLCDAIPLMIVNLNPLSIAPQELLDEINNNLDVILVELERNAVNYIKLVEDEHD